MTVLIVNKVGNEGYCDDIENYLLPVLQDTEEDDVFGVWDAETYDLFIINRDGRIAHVVSGSYPANEEHYNELLDLIPTL